MLYGYLKALFAKLPKRPLKAAVWTAVLVSAGSLFIPNHYSSDASVLPGDPKAATGSVGALTGLVAAISGSSGGDPSSSYVDILNSRWMADNLLKDTYDFQDHPFMFMPWKSRRMTLEDYLGVANHDKALRQFSDIFSVSHDLKSGLVTIGVETRSPELSKAVTNSALKYLDTFVNENSQSRSKATVVFLTNRLEDAKTLAAQAEDSLYQFATLNRGYHESNDPAVVLKGARLESDLSLRRDLVHTLSQNLEQALINEKDDTPVVNVLDAGNLPIEKHSPHRALLILAAALLAALLQWTWVNREWVKTKFKTT